MHTDDETRNERDRHRHETREERRTYTEHQSGEQIAPEIIGAEPVGAREAGESIGEVLLRGVEGREHRRQRAAEHHGRHEDERDNR